MTKEGEECGPVLSSTLRKAYLPRLTSVKEERDDNTK